MKKYILLDIDGVLTSDAFTRQCIFEYRRENLFGVDWFDPACIEALRCIIEQTDATIVISSSWRDLGEYKLKELWEYNQMPGQLDETSPTTPEYILTKEDAIGQWLSIHKEDKFVILDDSELGFPNLVKTNPTVGLTKKDARKAIKILNQ